MILKEENRRLFGEQVNDHIEKLNDLMNQTSGAVFDEQVTRRACLATRLLEGSTGMLGFSAWRTTLASLRRLLERAAAGGRRWDEQLSQIVSEVLETEEQLAAEILAGEIEEVGRAERFTGLEREIECLEGMPDEAAGPEPFSLPAAQPAAPASETAQQEIAERISTFTRLMQSIARVRDLYQEMVDKPGAERLIREIETAYGESEFFMRLAAENLRRLGRAQRPFSARISSNAVCEGVKDFFASQARIRRWNARLAVRCAECTLDGDMASALAEILSSCVFDVCKRYEMRDDLALSIGVDIRSEGSFIVARVQDNAPDFLRDSEIDRDDAGAFYQCLRDLRPRLESAGAILWLEPGGGDRARFMLTLPRSRGRTDYLIVTASGTRFAVPRHAIDAVLGVADAELRRMDGCRVLMRGGARVPVYALEELVTEELEEHGSADRILVMGSAERRIGLLVEGAGRAIEGVEEQVTEGSWGAITKGVLHIGEEEYAIIDAGCMLRTAADLMGAEGGLHEAGSYADAGSGCDREATVPRA